MSQNSKRYAGDRFAASIQTRVYQKIDSNLEHKGRQVNSDLAKFVNKKIDEMFRLSVTEYGLGSTLPDLDTNGILSSTGTVWDKLTASTIRKKNLQSTIYKDKGDLISQLKGKPPSGKKVSKVLGGFSNRSVTATTFTPVVNKVPVIAMRVNKKPMVFKKVISFSVFHALKSRAVPETIMDLLYSPDEKGTLMSMKLGYYRKENRPTKFKRSFLVPYTSFYARVVLKKKVENWARRKKA
jgi:hypothetical protein